MKWPSENWLTARKSSQVVEEFLCRLVSMCRVLLQAAMADVDQVRRYLQAVGCEMPRLFLLNSRQHRRVVAVKCWPAGEELVQNRPQSPNVGLHAHVA